MTFPANMVWEVRTGGSILNGGGFTTTGGGTDYTLQTAAQVAFNDLLIDAADNTKCTSAGNPFTSDMVGNCINLILSDGAWTVQRFYIVSVAAGVATCDRALGTVGATGGTGNLGGALATIVDIDTTIRPGNTVYVEEGTYSTTATNTITCDGGAAGLEIAFIGYPSGGSRTDVNIIEGDMPIFTSATNSVIIFSLNAATRLRFRNIKVTHTAATRGDGWRPVTSAPIGITFENCVTDGCAYGWGQSSAFGRTLWNRCIARNGTTGGFRSCASDSTFMHCIAYDNAGPGFSIPANVAGGSFFRCISYGNTGASGHGFQNLNTTQDSAGLCVFEGNVAYDNAQNGFHFAFTTGSTQNIILLNNISYGNTYGYACATAGVMDGSWPHVYNNAYGSNSSGNTLNFRAGEGAITLTADPFTNAAGADFSLNSTAGGGILLRQLGYPTEIGVKGSATPHYPDVGAAESKAATPAFAAIG